MEAVKRFILKDNSLPASLNAMSLFSSTGISDKGYERAGFEFHVHAEIDEYRAKIGEDNFPDSTWITGNLMQQQDAVIEAYGRRSTGRLDLLVATPPCQGMSTSNPTRGKRSSADPNINQTKNSLVLAILPIVKSLIPRMIVAENVRQLLTQPLALDKKMRVIDALTNGLENYVVFSGVIDIADYGIAQNRKRSIVVAIHREEACLQVLEQMEALPWPATTHGVNKKDHVTVVEWMMSMKYPSLDAKSRQSSTGEHPLHKVPFYTGDRYLQVSQIPPFSGQSAYQNDTCLDCHENTIPIGLIRCPSCANVLRHRPYVFENGRPRLIAGFKSSYRRMRGDRPSATITTNSSHVGSDFKIHPFENRVLSALECADLQTVPRSFKWDRPLKDGRGYSVRSAVGEAFPPYFTYLHGKIISKLLRCSDLPRASMKRSLAMKRNRPKG